MMKDNSQSANGGKRALGRRGPHTVETVEEKDEMVTVMPAAPVEDQDIVRPSKVGGNGGHVA